MHIAVCDDNIDELSKIVTLLEDCSNEREGSISYESFNNAIELLEAMKSRQFDLLLLDILMPGITGMDAAKEIRSLGSEVPIIFLSSSREYGVESYRVGAEDYIMKPACKDEILPVLDKQLKRLTQGEAYLTLKTGNSILKLPLLQIVYVEVINRSLQFYLTNGELREAYGYLRDHESDLMSNSHFYKPHRSYIVNLQWVTELNKKGFLTILGKTVPVARDAYSKAKTAYMKYLLSPNERRDTLC